MVLRGVILMCIQYLHIQHYYLQHHILFNASIIQVYNMPICSLSSADTHISSVAEIDIIMCDLVCMHLMEEGMYNSYYTAI